MTKANVDQNKCIKCGTCTIVCPNAFKFNDDYEVEVIENNDASEEEVDLAVSSCPVGAISK